LLFLLIWIVSWGVLYFVVLKTPPGYVVGVVTAIVVVIAAWLFVKFTPVGQDDNHVLSIGIGGGFGIIMLMNVWGIIWRNNKRIFKEPLRAHPRKRSRLGAQHFWLRGQISFSQCRCCFYGSEFTLHDIGG